MKKFNIFEGCRRIVYLILLAVLIGFIWNTATYEPRFHATYIKRSPTARFELAKEDFYCSAFNDGQEQLKIKAPSGVEVSITLCFPAIDYEGGQKLVPYMPSERGIWGGVPSSPEVQQYISDQVKSFDLPASDFDIIASPWKKRLDDAWSNLKVSAVVSFAVLIFSFALGWIARGFMNVPIGKDFRNT
jgi:hypothetical protein